MIISNFGLLLSCKAVKGKPLLPVSLCSPGPCHKPCGDFAVLGSGPVPSRAKQRACHGAAPGCDLPQLWNVASNLLLFWESNATKSWNIS